jgi:hypothetical protein
MGSMRIIFLWLDEIEGADANLVDERWLLVAGVDDNLVLAQENRNDPGFRWPVHAKVDLTRF